MEMLTRGTTTKSAQQIAETLDALGAQIETGCGNNSWFWRATCIKDDFPKLMDAYADVVNNPLFPDTELPGMKERVVAAIEGQDADWFAQAMRFFRKTYFAPANSPYQFTLLGTQDKVKAFDRAALSKWYYQTILRQPRVLAIYGDIDLAQARQLAQSHFGKSTTPTTPPPPARPTPPSVSNRTESARSPQITVTRVEINKTNNPQAGVVIGFKSDSVIASPDQPAIDLADCMTSGYGYPTGYIFEILRGRGLVYDANAMNFPGVATRTPGAFVAYAGCDPKNVNACVDVILESVARLQGADTDMNTDWFARSKSLIVTGDAVQNETPTAQANQAALDELYGVGHDYHAGFADRINAVSLAAVRRLAATRLRECVVTISTSEPEKVTVKPGSRTYPKFPPVDLTPKGVQHDSGSAQK
jgi:zinc protease